MIVQNDFLGKLKDFGLNSYEAKLWTALLSRGVSTAGELSDIANVPRSRSYDVLESLEKKGFIIMKLGKPIKYIAVPPSEVVERIKKKVQEEAVKHASLLDSLKGTDVLDELDLLHKNGIQLVDPSDMTGAVKGRNNLYDHLHTMIKNSKKSISIITTDTGLIRKTDALRQSLQKAKDRGVSIRILAPSKSVDLKNIAQLRAIEDDIKARMCIIDEQQVVLMPLDDKNTHANYDFGVWLNTEFLAQSLEKMFDVLWAKAKK
jgi:sugar-specific transcriptional regulator TrmB